MDIQSFLDDMKGSDLQPYWEGHTGKGGKLDSYLSLEANSQKYWDISKVCKVQPLGLAICLFLLFLLRLWAPYFCK